MSKVLTAADLVIGKKYVPKSKNGYAKFQSVHWMQAQTKNQSYLFYLGMDDEYHVFSSYDHGTDGDFFLASDMEEYEEGKDVGVEKPRPWPFNGYAPGNYQNTCRICSKDMIADKLCFVCLECAVIGAKEVLNTSLTSAPASEVTDPETQAATWDMLDAMDSDAARVWFIHEYFHLLPKETKPTHL